jgi:hypothetical protein
MADWQPWQPRTKALPMRQSTHSPDPLIRVLYIQDYADLVELGISQPYGATIDRQFPIPNSHAKQGRLPHDCLNWSIINA